MKTNRFLLAAGIALAMAFTFSCSSGGGGGDGGFSGEYCYSKYIGSITFETDGTFTCSYYSTEEGTYEISGKTITLSESCITSDEWTIVDSKTIAYQMMGYTIMELTKEKCSE